MARKASGSRTRARRASRPRNISASGKPARERAVAAFMAILADKPFEQIGLAEVATTAGLTLAELRAEFGSTLSIVAAFLKGIDRTVLADADPDMAEETPRERLFDVMMRRLEALAPYKEAVRSLVRSASRNPALAFALNGMAVQSQQWMLAAANIGSAGPKGMLRAQGLQMLFACVIRTWLDDDDPGLARTMAALDRELARGQRLSGLLDGLCSIPDRACDIIKGARRSRRGRGRDAAMAA